MTGSFDSTGSPVFPIQISGPDGATPLTASAVMDTGFSGFLLLPVSLAMKLNLRPYASMDVVLADGATQSKLICDGAATIEGLTRDGLVLLEDQGDEVLAGMEFLKTFGLTLIIDAKAMSIELKVS